MTCPSCKDIGSVVKTNPATGEFKIESCSCQLRTRLYFCQDTGIVLEVTEVVEGVMSVLEHHPSGKIRRIINKWLFENHVSEGIITPLPMEKTAHSL